MENTIKKMKKGVNMMNKKKIFRQLVSVFMAVAVFVTGMYIFPKEVQAEETYTTLYLIDNTKEKWIGKDDAVIELVDNSSGHDRYVMTKVNDTTWSARVPKSAYNITFNRYNSDKTTQWNSWSAGGRDANNAYCADGSEYGHWSVIQEIEREENYFHAGDIIYLDVSDFVSWKNDNAVMYANFSTASKVENSGKDVGIPHNDKTLYNPKNVGILVSENIYVYVVSVMDEGATDLRFWRGSVSALWNCSDTLTYEDYKEGINTVKITGWNSSTKQAVTGVSMDMEADADGDGMVDGVESILGLNYKVEDTDGDGLIDYFEYAFCDLNPLVKDTDGDGVLDVDEDGDEDGLTNALEYIYNTNPLVKDTDKDGLNDNDEVVTYSTQPLEMDTDGDGLSDYDDVKLGFSPLEKDTDNDGILDANENVQQIFEQEIIDSERKAINKVSIELSTNGNIENTSTISNMYNIDKMSSDVVGLVGVPVEINCNSEFEEATITFWYDKNELGDTNENDLAVMWYDIDNHCYRLLDGESVINTERGTVSYVTTHFSTYMLVDRTKWYDAWKENLDYRTNTSGKSTFYEFAFVIDVSGSMSGTRISTAKEALKGFVEQLSSKDVACLVKFNSYASVVSDFTNDKDVLNNAISKLDATGGTNVNLGLLKAIELYDKQESSERKKAIVLLCDGDVNYSETTVNQCIEKGISIYTVNVGTKSSGSYLKMMSEKTDGEYYYCTSTENIEEVLGVIQGETIEEVDPTDTDGDGLFDIYETVGIRLTNGRVIQTDPKSDDTDGDGLTDYEEVGIVYSTKLEIGDLLTIKGKYVQMYSDPLVIDTDHDGKLDSEDEKPWTYDAVKNLLIHQSSRLKGLNADGTVADDMKYGKTSRTDILAINDMFKYQLDEADSDYWGPDTLFSEFRNMSTSLFATGDMEDVILDMISQFEEGTGSDYSNETLTKEAYEHQSTQRYINDIKGEVVRRLKNNGGNIYDLEFTEEGNQTGKSIYNWVQQNVSYPRFHENSDIISGLTICVNDTWGNTVEVKDYTFDGEHFSGTLHFCIYDHFGLNRPDVEKMYVNLAGFRAWYVLQHYDQFDGSYVPFVSLMEFDVPFEGDIIMLKSAS